MDKPTKLLIAGVACGVIVEGLGLANIYRLERTVEERVTACSADVGAQMGATLCDPAIVVRDYEKDVKGYPSGAQRELAVAQIAVNEAPLWPFMLAATIAIALALPWCWYAVRREIEELR